MPTPTSDPSPPLVTHIYTADPSAHVFNDKLYVYPSHDRETDIKFNDNGDQYDMTDYHALSLSPNSLDLNNLSTAPAATTSHGPVLTAAQIPWVSKQVWAPDCAFNAQTGKYYLFFPARNKAGRFQMGVAISESPEGPFEPKLEAMKGSYSIDPCSFVDEKKWGGDGKCYLYFGGLWGGEMQCFKTVQPSGEWWEKEAEFDKGLLGPKERSGKDVYAMGPRAARLDEGMCEFDEEGVKELQILDPDTGKGILADDHERRFFEASWMHVYDRKYYFSYSTGDTHNICYAVGDGPLGPFTYRGVLLGPVIGWTNHHSVVQYGKTEAGEERWWVFYHDCELSGGVDHLRSVRMREVWYDGKGDMHLSPQ